MRSAFTARGSPRRCIRPCARIPDVVLVGELRDLETMSIAVTAAEMGILVMGTLHTNGAAATVDRIVNAFPSDKQGHVRTMLSTSLRGVISQQLIQRADKRGRVAALEILVNTPAVSNLIRQGKLDQLENTMQSGAQQGMRTMDSAIQELLDKGVITGRAALREEHQQAALRATEGRRLKKARRGAGSAVSQLSRGARQSALTGCRAGAIRRAHNCGPARVPPVRTVDHESRLNVAPCSSRALCRTPTARRTSVTSSEYMQTDIWVRFQKLRGHDCLYVCASDTHGTPTMLKARQEGITPEELIARIGARAGARFRRLRHRLRQLPHDALRGEPRAHRGDLPPAARAWSHPARVDPPGLRRAGRHVPAGSLRARHLSALRREGPVR